MARLHDFSTGRQAIFCNGLYLDCKQTFSIIFHFSAFFMLIDTDRLLASLRVLPRCEKLTKRTLQNYLYGNGGVPAHVISALAVVLDQPVEAIVRAVTR